MPTDKLSQAAFGAASSALVAHSGGGLPGGMSGKPGTAQEVDLEDLFSLKRPKNVLSGASSGLQSVAKGAEDPSAGVTQSSACRARAAAPPRRRVQQRRMPPPHAQASRARHTRVSVWHRPCGCRLCVRLFKATKRRGAGVIGGATALIAAPALGAREEGAVGFLKGLGAGARSSTNSQPPHPAARLTRCIRACRPCQRRHASRRRRCHRRGASWEARRLCAAMVVVCYALS